MKNVPWLHTNKTTENKLRVHIYKYTPPPFSRLASPPLQYLENKSKRFVHKRCSLLWNCTLPLGVIDRSRSFVLRLLLFAVCAHQSTSMLHNLSDNMCNCYYKPQNFAPNSSVGPLSPSRENIFVVSFSIKHDVLHQHKKKPTLNLKKLLNSKT